MKEFIKGANPYLPLWEHIPDGEPRVFEHNGEKRVYITGNAVLFMQGEIPFDL